MFSNPHSDRLKQTFAAQFEGEAPDITYRKNSKAAPVKVSAEERDAFIAAYARAIRYSIWGTVVGTIILIGGITLLAIRSGGQMSEMSIYIGTGGLIAVFSGLQMWAWYAPARALRDRLSSGAPRSRAEMRRILFARITWGQLGLGAVAAGFMLFNAANRWDVLHGWGRLWVVMAAGLLALIAVQAFRKWRFEAGARRP